jgi:hypothetical protein
MSEPPNIPSNDPSYNINLNGTTNLNIRDVTITLKIDPSILSALQTSAATGLQSRAEANPVQPAQHTPTTVQYPDQQILPTPSVMNVPNPTKTRTRTQSDYEVEDVLSLDSSAATDRIASDENGDDDTADDDTAGSLTAHEIGRIDQYPVYHWKHYPYTPNGSVNPDTYVRFFVKKPDETDSESGATPAFNLKFAYSYLTYGAETRRPPYWVRKQCLGVFQCTMKGCKFLATPMRGRKKGMRSLPADCKVRCPSHTNQPLLHIPCHARLWINEDTPSYYCVQVMEQAVYGDQAAPARLCAVEKVQTRRTRLGQSVGGRPTRLAH